MRIVIAGGTGLIGRALSWHFVAAGDEVTVLTRGGAARERVIDGARTVEWGSTLGSWTACLDGADVLVNLCGANIADGRWTPARKEELKRSRIDPGHLLADAVCSVAVPPALLVQASGVGFYGSAEDVTFDESTPVGRDFLATLALDWEASSVAVPPVTRRIVARFAPVLSRDGGVLPRLLPPFRWYVGATFGDGHQWFPWIHVDDVVAAVEYLAFETDVHGPVNLVAPEPATNRDFAEALGRVLHRPARLRIPRQVLSAALGEQATLLLEGQRVRPRVLEENGFIFNSPGVELALHDLLS
jgi:uncharacterized protein (TIGR01777 family)